MAQRDILSLILSYVYAFGLLLVVEALGKRLKWPQYLTRKLVHIGAGMWVWGTLILSESRLGLIPFATFILLNFVFYRFQVFKAMDATDSTPGTIYFAVSITVLLGLFWRPQGPIDRVPIAIAATMAMTWGDGLASIVGQSFGKHPYRVLGHQRSWEGSATMALFSLLTILVTLLVLPSSSLSPYSPSVPPGAALVLSLIGAGIATAAEGLSPAGTDNLTVPLATGAILYLLAG